MNTLVKIGSVLYCCGLAACASQPLGSPGPPPVTLTWASAANDAELKSITYNVYAVPGAGPIPTIQTKSAFCGVTTFATGSPLNSQPIVGTTYSTSLAAGRWTFAVEAVSSDGCRSPLSSPVTVSVPIQGDSPTNGAPQP